MFPATGSFRDLVCPDNKCCRPYCSFWHPGERYQEPATSQTDDSLQTMNIPTYQSFPPVLDPYNPYTSDTSTFSGYAASVAYQPTIIPAYNVQTTSDYTGYVAEEIDPYIPTTISAEYDYTTSTEPATSFEMETIKAVPIKQEPKENNDDCVIIEPPLKVKQEPIDCNDFVPPSSSKKVLSLPMPPILIKKNLPTPDQSNTILDCAKSISDIDAEIERLKKLKEEHKQKASVLRVPKQKVKVETMEEKSAYVPKPKEKGKPVGYTPTPLIELERKKEEKRKREGAGKIRIERQSSSELSQEDLFGEDPVPKKQRIENFNPVVRPVTLNNPVDSLPKEKKVHLTPQQIAAAKQRVARPGAVARPVTHRAPSAMEAFKARMEKFGNEKLLPTSTDNRTKTQEQIYGEKRTVKDGRIARTLTQSAKPVAKLELMDSTNTKVPSALRMTHLKKMYEEYIKFVSKEEAKNKAEESEKEVFDKVKHKQGYNVAVMNALKRIRDIGEGKTSNSSSKISHEQQIFGKAYGNITLNAKGPKQAVIVTEEKLYTALVENYLLENEQLGKNCYPVWEISNVKVSIEPSYYDKKRLKRTFVSDFDMDRTCVRCNKEFQLNRKGTIVEDPCIYHLKGKARKPGKIRNNEATYLCCGSDDSVEGCQMGKAHVFDTLRESELLKFQATPPPTGPNDRRSTKILALDCEMIYTVWGPALARVTVVDFSENVVLDEIVKPDHPVIDFNTTFSGITKEQLDKAKHNQDSIIKKFFEFANNQTILIGHSLESDLKALRVVHERVVDTSVLFPHRIDEQKKRGLKELCLDKLGKTIQDDIDGHDSKEDSIAALQLVIYKAKFDGKLV